MITILLLALAGVVIGTVVGTLWYSPGTPTGKIHMQYLGFDKLSDEEKKMKIETSKPMMPKLYATQMLLTFLTSFVVVFIMRTSLQNGVPLSMAFGFIVINWLCFMVPVTGSSILWSNCDRSIALKKFFSDSTANLVIVLLIGGMASLFA